MDSTTTHACNEISEDVRFYEYCCAGNFCKVSELIRDGSYYNLDLKLALSGAAKSGHLGIFNLLLGYHQYCLDPLTIDNINDALKTSAQYGHIDAVRLLIYNGANDIGGALYWAALGGHANIIRWLLPIDSTTKNCALFAAASSGSIECFDLLISYGADEWPSAFYAACNSGHLEIIKKICDGHRSKIITDAQWNRGFINASSRGHVKLIKWLLNYSCYPQVGSEVRNAEWVWGFHAAMGNNHINCARIILRFGAKNGYVDLDKLDEIIIDRSVEGLNDKINLIAEINNNLRELPSQFKIRKNHRERSNK